MRRLLASILCVSTVLCITGTAIASEWTADPYSTGGTVIGCAVNAPIVFDSGLRITMTWLLLMEKRSPDRVESKTVLKVAVLKLAAKDQDAATSVHLRDAWVKSASGSTVGKMTPVSPPDYPAFLAAASSDLFQDVLKGFVEHGATIGFRRLFEELDTVVTIQEPLSEKAFQDFISCLEDLKRSLQ